ncbi:2-deoxyribose-5-phosphate aldolase [Legionella wadsworthii]|uniref:deoxyribose-phosphate aldolase n=1 Tax=Legionella wadsworthii TaxID=28088 RepID=A0A378LRN2_9GAMM|nr:deoxyribose-phosphate aldolase [Legionella wadsworthii]STY29414.1 2-deoxyribose-5-phosphate aldolase [Legionella wadsworthii]
MSLEVHFNEVMEELLGAQAQNHRASEQLIHSIDLTLLDDLATSNSLSQLKFLANQNQVAAICVYLQHLDQFQSDNDVKLATVINFPHGNENLDYSLASVEKAILLGVSEIDYVLPYSMYLEGKKQEALNHCCAVAQLSKQHNMTLKIIIETGAFPEMRSIYDVSIALVETGCHFLKTSTGKIPTGACLTSVFAILSAIKDTKAHCGIKISGGVKQPQQAYHYAKLAELMMGKQISPNWFRIGASSLLEELLKIN